MDFISSNFMLFLPGYKHNILVYIIMEKNNVYNVFLFSSYLVESGFYQQ